MDELSLKKLSQGRSSQVVGWVISIIAVVAFLVLLVDSYRQDADLRKVDTAIIDSVLPYQAYTENPNLTTSEKQSYSYVFNDAKRKLKNGTDEIRNDRLSQAIALYAFGLMVCVGIGVTLVQHGKTLQKLAEEAVERQKAEDEGKIDHSWRKNPFQKGTVSDRVIPRKSYMVTQNRSRQKTAPPSSEEN